MSFWSLRSFDFDFDFDFDSNLSESFPFPVLFVSFSLSLVSSFLFVLDLFDTKVYSEEKKERREDEFHPLQ